MVTTGRGGVRAVATRQTSEKCICGSHGWLMRSEGERAIGEVEKEVLVEGGDRDRDEWGGGACAGKYDQEQNPQARLCQR